MMATQLKPDLDQSISRRFGTLADDARVRANDRRPRSATASACFGPPTPRKRGASCWASSRMDPRCITAPPRRSTISGITDEIEKSGRYEPVRPRIWSMDRATQADEIRRLTAAPDVMLGSVHAVTETGVADRGLDEWQPARPVRQRRRAGHPRRRDAEDRVRPRGGPPPHRRVRLPARGCPRPGGVRHPQRREQGPRSSTARSPPAGSPSSSSTRSSASSAEHGAAHHGHHRSTHIGARGRPRRGRPHPPDDGPRDPRTPAVRAHPVRAGGPVHPRP